MQLRAEYKWYRPMGGNKDKKADVRIIATNEDMQSAIAESVSVRTCYIGLRNTR